MVENTGGTLYKERLQNFISYEVGIINANEMVKVKKKIIKNL